MKFLKATLILWVILPLPVLAKGTQVDPRLIQDIADIRRIQDSNAQALAAAIQDITTLKQDLMSIKGSIEENRHFVQEGTQNNERILKDYDLRLTTMEERISVVTNQMQDFLNRSIVGSKPQTPPAPEGSPEDLLYKRALSEINLQNYRGALQLLDDFMKQYPKSSMTDNAQYWKGEAYFASRQYPQAVMEFQKVIKQYPTSNKIAAAILKQGYCFYETKSYLDAKAFLQKVMRDFPKTDEAGQARERIQKIDQLLAKDTASVSR